MANLPVANAPVLDASGRFTQPWYLLLQQISTPPYQKSAAISGAASLTIPPTSVYYLNPSAAVTSLALTFPSAGDAWEMTIANISPTYTISSVTYPASVVGGASSFAANGFARFKFSLQDVKWYRIG